MFREKIEAGNGNESLEVLKRTEAVDLVLTDIIMPDLGGPELARKVRDILDRPWNNGG